MKEGDKVYSITKNNIVEVLKIEEHTDYNLVKVNDGSDMYTYDTNFLTMEQCAEIIANTELQQLVLKYKK